jgi:hypothetical protein
MVYRGWYRTNCRFGIHITLERHSGHAKFILLWWRSILRDNYSFKWQQGYLFRNFFACLRIAASQHRDYAYRDNYNWGYPNLLWSN